MRRSSLDGLLLKYKNVISTPSATLRINSGRNLFLRLSTHETERYLTSVRYDRLFLCLGNSPLKYKVLLRKRERKPFLSNPLSYTCDNLYRLSQATNPLPSTTYGIFTYDPVGNRLTTTGQGTPSVFDDANRLIEDQEFTCVYDFSKYSFTLFRTNLW